ncbi:holo-ACP synthase [Sulfobacillus harzensis]|uniref:Holo-[acyl-carrier-protein] synthase n=1 Tax=Sulfobacillus harzensis TaxID=2729629 RepID=A0A7Y0L4L5_9FIRM|nr:holo-ACP synthase [Sulfobacillus harzensis]
MGVDGGKALAPGLGIDITEVERIRGLAERQPRALERLFTPTELHDAGQGVQRAARLAARFAGKEALIKAAGGLYQSTYHDIEIRRRPGLSPSVSVSGPLGAWLQEQRLTVKLSLSHERQFAVAMVLLVPQDKEGDARATNMDA